MYQFVQMSLEVERKPRRRRGKSKARPLFLPRRKAQTQEKKGNETFGIIDTERVPDRWDIVHAFPPPSPAAPAATPTAGASPWTTRPAPSSTLSLAPPAPATPFGSSAERC